MILDFSFDRRLCVIIYLKILAHHDHGWGKGQHPLKGGGDPARAWGNSYGDGTSGSVVEVENPNPLIPWGKQKT